MGPSEFNYSALMLSQLAPPSKYLTEEPAVVPTYIHCCHHLAHVSPPVRARAVPCSALEYFSVCIRGKIGGRK